MTPVSNIGVSCDPRMRRGAYITNGRDLYYVLGTIETPAARPYGAPHVTLEVENCTTGFTSELEMARVRSDCRLVRDAIDPSALSHGA